MNCMNCTGGGKGDTRRARESKAVLEARGEYVAPENNNRDRDDKGGDRGFGGPPRDGGFRYALVSVFLSLLMTRVR